MRAYGMKFNPTKCTFGVGGGKFLGYMVSSRRIEANPEKIEAILKLKSPTSIKDVYKLTASGRLVKWAIELGEHDIDYHARTSEKAQILVDVVMQLSSESIQEMETRILHVDGSSNASNGEAGILIQGPKGVEIKVAARLSFPATNNEAEYEALILGLELAYAAGA
ncbi:uncharacterized protein LOC105162221 [Sesamum indicum]|uniref:Uncharacterized protein LOC105162221 n=1 Tax=Sesamum indicum TaxID=4182 RepID=A0A6I9T5X2_SESIN|nr:uncharacterized protein LOC105162221 [Sesamum indicum]